MKRTINVCAFPYTKRYYLRHPLRWLRDLKEAFQNLWHRAFYGYAWIDLWNMDTYLLELIPNMLHELGDRSEAYADSKFPNLEAQRAYLHALEFYFRKACAFYSDMEGAGSLELAPSNDPITERVRSRFVGLNHADLTRSCFSELAEAIIHGILWD